MGDLPIDYLFQMSTIYGKSGMNIMFIPLLHSQCDGIYSNTSGWNARASASTSSTTRNPMPPI